MRFSTVDKQRKRLQFSKRAIENHFFEVTQFFK